MSKYFEIKLITVVIDHENHNITGENCTTIHVESKDLETLKDEINRILSPLVYNVEIGRELTEKEWFEIHPPEYPCMGCGTIGCSATNGECVR